MKPPGAIPRFLARRSPATDLLAHHYHRVDPAQVWTIAAKEVPAIVAALRSI